MTAILTDHNLRQCVTDIANHAKVSCIVETGTNDGTTTLWLAQFGVRTWTIELDDDLFRQAYDRFAEHRNIKPMHGDSAEILERCLGGMTLGESTLFLLDAHWLEDWPLRRELQAINSAREVGDKCVVLIDDWFVRGCPQFAGCYGGLKSDDSEGRENELIPCGYNPPFDAELDKFPHFYEPIYESGGIGYSIFSDFPLLLGDNFRTNR